MLDVLPCRAGELRDGTLKTRRPTATEVDTSRASREVGFVAKISLLDGLKKAVEW